MRTKRGKNKEQYMRTKRHKTKWDNNNRREAGKRDKKGYENRKR